MRKILANIVFGGGMIASFALAGFWIYFMWSFDWGRGRQWNLALVIFLFGTFAILILGGLFFSWLSERIAPPSATDAE